MTALFLVLSKYGCGKYHLQVQVMLCSGPKWQDISSPQPDVTTKGQKKESLRL